MEKIREHLHKISAYEINSYVKHLKYLLSDDKIYQNKKCAVVIDLFELFYTDVIPLDIKYYFKFKIYNQITECELSDILLDRVGYTGYIGVGPFMDYSRKLYYGFNK